MEAVSQQHCNAHNTMEPWPPSEDSLRSNFEPLIENLVLIPRKMNSAKLGTPRSTQIPENAAEIPSLKATPERSKLRNFAEVMTKKTYQRHHSSSLTNHNQSIPGPWKTKNKKQNIFFSAFPSFIPRPRETGLLLQWSKYSLGIGRMPRHQEWQALKDYQSVHHHLLQSPPSPAPVEGPEEKLFSHLGDLAPSLPCALVTVFKIFFPILILPRHQISSQMTASWKGLSSPPYPQSLTLLLPASQRSCS